MAGLLDFVKSPEGQGLLSAAFGGLAGARRGAPINSLGRAGLAGLSGYAGAQDREAEQAQLARRNNLYDMQAQSYQAEALAKQAALEQQKRKASYLSGAGQPMAGGAAMADGNGPSPENAGNIGRSRQFDPISALAAGFTIDEAQKLAGAGNWGRQKVARTVKGLGADGREYEHQVDEYGQRVGDGLAQFRAPLMQDLGGKVAALDPYSLKPVSQFGKSMTPDGRDASARGWANVGIARDRLNYDKTKVGGGKPLPAPALKMQQEELNAIGTASAIQADLGALEKQIADGKLKFGGARNLYNTAKNMAGFSDEESRNLSSFKSSLERLRNDSLRLNTGVQTDGDAQRAWSELFENINDTALVKQRLAEIKKINERAVNIRKMNVDSIRGNYGHDPMDTGGYQNQAAAVGAKPAGSILDQADAILNGGR